jgi:hypothetical protein
MTVPRSKNRTPARKTKLKSAASHAASPGMAQSPDPFSSDNNAPLKASMFRKTQNPVYGLESFCISVEEGVVPDEHILKWLRECFLLCLEHHRLNRATKKNSLDHIMGLSSKPGGTPAYKTALLAERNEMLLLDIARLRSLPMRLTTDEAAEMAARRLADTRDWNKSSWKLANIGHDTLVKSYNRWPSHLKLEERLKDIVTGKWGPDKIREYLRQYPHDSLPPKLRSLFAGD